MNDSNNNKNNNISYQNVKEIFSKITKSMYGYYNYFQMKNRLLENDCVQIGYINEYILDNIDQMNKIYSMKKNKKIIQKTDAAYLLQSSYSTKNIFGDIYKKKINQKNKIKSDEMHKSPSNKSHKNKLHSGKKIKKLRGK